MSSLLIIVNWLLPLLYAVLLIDYGACFFLRIKAQSRNAWLVPVLGLHGLFLVLRAIHLGQPPLADIYEILSVMALSTGVVYALVEFASRDRRTGVFIFTLVFLFQYTSSSFLGQSSTHSAGWARLHTIPALVACTAFAIAAVYGLLNLLAERNLRKHRFGVLFDRLPPLDLLGRMTWHALLGGFIFITITMITGALFSHWGGAEQVMEAKLLAKIIIGSLAWVIYTVAVVGKLLGKWSSPRISGIAVAGFVVIMILLIVSGILS